MSFVATSNEYSLAEAVGSALFLARAKQSGACLWCGARSLEITSAGGDTCALTIRCRVCGSELAEESPVVFKAEVA
jgi:transcription elongation factor Elf1